MSMTVDQRERIDRWYEQHGEFPRLVLGYRRRDPLKHRSAMFCVDHGDSGSPVLTDDDDGETAKCAQCGRHLRGAARFGEVSQADLRDDGTATGTVPSERVSSEVKST